jgi:hypothetical protein
MKLVQEVQLFDTLRAVQRPPLDAHLTQIRAAIEGVRNPPFGDEFVLYPERLANGVAPIKTAFQLILKDHGWTLEARLFEKIGPGKVDAARTDGELTSMVEWETGNISSSHRALEKMILAMLQSRAQQGVLVLPGRQMARYLTDRVGNWEELLPYRELHEMIGRDVLASHDIPGRLLAFVVEHDKLDTAAPRITKGTDGRALR